MPRIVDTQRISTADELLAMPDDGYRYDLRYGVLRRMSPPGFRHGAIASRFNSLLRRYVEEHDLGVVAVESGFLLATDPDLVLAPDVSFVQKERIPHEGLPVKYWPGAPDLAVEVVSPSDTYVEVHDKAADLLRHGTAMVVVVEPARRRLVVHRSEKDVTILTEEDVFAGADVVPGFQLCVHELFAL